MKTTGVTIIAVAVVALVIGALAGWGFTAMNAAKEAERAQAKYEALEQKYEELEEEHLAFIESYDTMVQSLEALQLLVDSGAVPTAGEMTDLIDSSTDAMAQMQELLDSDLMKEAMKNMPSQ